MDTTAQRARDREAFRELLEKHHYAPQGRFARVGTLEDTDLDALGRGTLGPVWAWAWRNIKNAEDMEIIQRNVKVARYSIDSCKHEREQAKAKRETLLSRKQQLEDALRQAREREHALLTSVRGVEDERDALRRAASEKRQRELLRKAFNEKNDTAMAATSDLLDEAQWLATVEDTKRSVPSENQVDILLAEFKRMLKSTRNAENVDFGDSDIKHLRDSSGSDLIAWLLEAAARPHDDVPEDDDDAKYAAHVEQNASSSHDALVQIQNLLRQSQAEHIATFIKTQKVYAKGHDLKRRVDEAEDAQYGLWGNENAEPNGGGGGEYTLAAETVALQLQSQANAVALNAATRAYDDVVSQVETHRQQKQELEHKVALMNQFDERQQDIVAHIRATFRQNQELLQSLTHKQSRLVQFVADETRPRVEQDSERQLTTWSRLVMEELRAFSALGLSRLDTAQMQLPVYHTSSTEHTRQGEAAVPFEDFYINQLQTSLSCHGTVSHVSQQQQRNGYQRLAQALELPACANWASILASLRESDEEHTREINETIQQLEHDIGEDRAQSIPEAQALLSTIQQSTDAMTSASISRLEHVVHVNIETMQRLIPELDQTIDNWYNQPAWAARVEQPASMQRHLDASSSSAMEVTDLLT